MEAVEEWSYNFRTACLHSGLVSLYVSDESNVHEEGRCVGHSAQREGWASP
jgi:hypothetical protein